MSSRLVAGLLCLFALEARAAVADNYAYAWPLTTSGDSAAWQVELTPDVYGVIRDDGLRDIEVINAAGEAVPMAPRAAQTTSTAQASDFELPQFQLDAEAASAPESLNLHIERGPEGQLRRLDLGATEGKPTGARSGDLLLDASAVKAPLDSVVLDWNETADVNAQFSVSGSDDLQQWQGLVGAATVMALHQGGNELARHRIALNGTQLKYLRLHRLDKGGEIGGLRVQARTLARSTLTQPARVWVEAQPTPAPSTESRNPPGFYYRLPAPLAIDALKLELASDNSLARVRVASRMHPGNDASAWAIRSEFTAFRLREADNVIGNDEMAVTFGGRAQDWRIDPATPLDRAPTLRVAFRPDRFVFLAQGAGPYRLVAGSARSRRGDYPVDAALAQLHGKLGADWQPPLANLGTRVALQGESALVAPPPPRDWKTWILWSVLIGAAMLIGGLALSLLRKPPQ